MSQPCRLPRGGLIDRRRRLAFRFNGRRYQGYAGDTLASALLANGVKLVARSFKYHRPRGILAAGAEEPNALVQLGRGARTVPNLKATEVELYDGLEARSVNVFPSLHFDLGTLLGALSLGMPAGFYYKTFFASPWLWNHVFEPLIRRAGGWGIAPDSADPDCYDCMHIHCDVLVVGGGPAGLMAARTVAESDARVVLLHQDGGWGGGLKQTKVRLDGGEALAWVADTIGSLEQRPEVRLLTRTTATGYYDDDYVVALQHTAESGHPGTPARPRQRLWHIRAGRVILATGAHERSLVFTNNDRPGIMLAASVQAYINRWAVLPGRRMVLFTNNDRAYACALDCLDAGGTVVAIVDSRADPTGALVGIARERGIEIHSGHAVVDTGGRRALRWVQIAPLREGRTDPSRGRTMACELLAVSGGYDPVVHLHSHAQGTLQFDESTACFRPDGTRQNHASVGACNGTFDLATALAEARQAGMDAAKAYSHSVTSSPAIPDVSEFSAGSPEPLWRVGTSVDRSASGRHQYIDLQNDSTVFDLRLAVREGFESVEHMKRYTLTGFGTDQGKISNINALAVLADITGHPIPEVGTTTFRPPFAPITFGAMGGRHRGEMFDPARLTAMHDQHVALGAVFEDVGQWKRPRYYPRPGEPMQSAVARECAAVRGGVGVIDASTLGKIELQGPDGAELLERVYTNHWRKLPVGRVRYGVMCGEDGMLFDDGTTARIARDRYLMTTTTGGAPRVLDHLEEYLQTEWPALRVWLTSVSEQWSVVAIAGPESRAVLAALAPDLDLSPEAFPFLSWQAAAVADLPARVFRISFTGELQYEINVPWHLGPALWEAVMEAGRPHGITPYGTETMHVLRAEKGFIIAGQDTDGTQTPIDLGMDWIVSDNKDFIGRRSMARSDMVRPDRPQLVGFRPQSNTARIPEGSQLVENGADDDAPPVPMIGFVTSSYFSPTLDHPFGLALVKGGRRRHGDVVEAALADGAEAVTLCDPVFYDPGNERRDG